MPFVHAKEYANYPLFQIVDPANTLPNPIIELAGFEDYATYKNTAYALLDGAKRIGSFILNEYPEDKTGFITPHISKIATHRGKGFGLATYLWAATTLHKQGYDFTCDLDDEKSEDAYKVWQRLTKAGVVEVVEPFKVATVFPNGEKTYSGHVVIPAHITDSSL